MAVAAVTTVLRAHVTAGEIEDLLAVLPEKLRVLVRA